MEFQEISRRFFQLKIPGDWNGIPGEIQDISRRWPPCIADITVCNSIADCWQGPAATPQLSSHLISTMLPELMPGEHTLPIFLFFSLLFFLPDEVRRSDRCTRNVYIFVEVYVSFNKNDEFLINSHLEIRIGHPRHQAINNHANVVALQRICRILQELDQVSAHRYLLPRVRGQE